MSDKKVLGLKKEAVEPQVIAPVKPKVTKFGVVIYRDGPGWRTDCIEVDENNQCKLVKSLEPNFKSAAYSYGMEFIEGNTNK